jgi:hypothetical protein
MNLISRTFEKSFIRYNIKTFTANIIQVVWKLINLDFRVRSDHTSEPRSPFSESDIASSVMSITSPFDEVLRFFWIAMAM